MLFIGLLIMKPWVAVDTVIGLAHAGYVILIDLLIKIQIMLKQYWSLGSYTFPWVCIFFKYVISPYP